MSHILSAGSLDPQRPWHLSWDAILFTILWASQFWLIDISSLVIASRENDVSLIVNLLQILNSPFVPPLLLVILMLYVGADLWASGGLQFNLKLAAVWLSVIAFVILPTLAAIIYRHNSAPYQYIHDGAIQIEEATKFLLAAKNPYAENYSATPMAQWPFHEAGLTVNPALDHFIYLPFLPIMSAPFYLLSQAILGWFDERFVYLLLLVGTVLLVLSLKQCPRDRLAVLMILTLNPLFVPFFIEGRNDSVVSFWLLAAVILLQRGRISWATVMVACAAASKQTAWFVIPFLVVHTFRVQQVSPRWRQFVKQARAFLPAAMVLGAMIVPFLIWNDSAFVDDVVSYQSGTSATGTSYPISSVGLGGLALGLNLIKSHTDPFPFAWLQIGIGSLVLTILLYRQWRNNTLTQLLTNYALLLFVFAFLSRVFNDNHLGFALTWLILPAFIGAGSPVHATPTGVGP